MKYKDIYWNLFMQSGDPDAYMQYRRQETGGSAEIIDIRAARRKQKHTVTCGRGGIA